MVGKILRTAATVPEQIISNGDLAKTVQTSDQWITERTGIKTRHIAQTESVVSLATKAAKKALGPMDPLAIDMIIVSSVTSDALMPSAAAEIQKNLGAYNATGFDINAACSGFIYAYTLVQAHMSAGWCENALIIGAETLSHFVDWQDRETCILFGDGAGASLMTSVPGTPYVPFTRSFGQLGDALTCNPIYPNAPDKGNHTVLMDGRNVFKFAVKEVSNAIHSLLETNNTPIESVDLFILHQANLRIIQSIARRLKVDPQKFPTNLEKYGNTSSASIPLLIAELEQSGRLKKGQKVVLAGFGAGLTIGACLLDW